MKGDFSRNSFDAKKHFSQVLLQQGRVTLDADPNEQAAILLHYLRTLAADLIGPCGGPARDLGFMLNLDHASTPPGLIISAGRYYVDGILVENEADCDYANQPDRQPSKTDDPLLVYLGAPGNDDVWVYLDVWEKHVSWIEDDTIREVALGGPDTCTRAKVAWQVRAIGRAALVVQLQARHDRIEARLNDPNATLTQAERDALAARLAQLVIDIRRLGPGAAAEADLCDAPLDGLDAISDALMTARLDPGQQIKDACSLAPDALYRGVENHLYRVEIHQGSAAGVMPTFKWSRDNGSVATRWLATEGNDLIVTSTRGFTARTWVELSSDADDSGGQPGQLVMLTKVEGDRLGVDPDSLAKGRTLALTPDMTNAKVRRWDQTETDDITLADGAVPLTEATPTDPHWTLLEDGIQVKFAAGGVYRSGDYWLIPARVATGGIEWPNTVDAAGAVTWLARAPDGVEHHHAPLGFVGLLNGELNVSSCSCVIEPINSCSQARNAAAAGEGSRPAKPKVPAKPK